MSVYIKNFFKALKKLIVKPDGLTWVQLGDETRKVTVYGDEKNGEQSLYIMASPAGSPKKIMLGLYNSKAGTFDWEAFVMMERAQKQRQLQIANINGKILIVGPKTTLEEAKLFWNEGHTSVREALADFLDARRPSFSLSGPAEKRPSAA